MSDRKNSLAASLGPAAIVVLGVAYAGRQIGRVAGAIEQVAGAVSAPGTPADRLAGCADRLAGCVSDWTDEMSTPWPQKLLPWRRWSPRVQRPGIR